MYSIYMNGAPMLLSRVFRQAPPSFSLICIACFYKPTTAWSSLSFHKDAVPDVTNSFFTSRLLINLGPSAHTFQCILQALFCFFPSFNSPPPPSSAARTRPFNLTPTSLLPLALFPTVHPLSVSLEIPMTLCPPSMGPGLSICLSIVSITVT